MSESLYITAMPYQDTIAEVLTWAALVFAAGFIGFFGKYLGRLILDRFHRGKSPGVQGAAPRAPVPQAPTAPSQEGKLSKKAEKNRLKAEKKQAKKGSKEEGQ
ncbi:MAG TPA: hypothetical protein PK545_08740 [Deltaproteobacteria bacterium]|nr:hypothetical protein [Deltaproteobacteria bacterium]